MPQISPVHSPQRLATGEWFTSRVSSCGTFISAYPRAPENLKSDLRTLYAHLCRDETPMVRRAAAQNLAAFARMAEPELVPKDFVPLFHHLTQDGTGFWCVCHVCQKHPVKHLSCGDLVHAE